MKTTLIIATTLAGLIGGGYLISQELVKRDTEHIAQCNDKSLHPDRCTLIRAWGIRSSTSFSNGL